MKWIFWKFSVKEEAQAELDALERSILRAELDCIAQRAHIEGLKHKREHLQRFISGNVSPMELYRKSFRESTTNP